MSLVSRVSLFFLLALGLILSGYSALFYLLVSRQLHQQFDQQLFAALHQLTAAVEVEPDDVKFEPSDHTLHLGSEDGLEDIRWCIFDEEELPVANSQNLKRGATSEDGLLQFSRRLHVEHAAQEMGEWRVLQHRLAAPQPKPKAERDPLERAVLIVTVARSDADLNSNLRRIGLVVTLLPIGLWLGAAVLGRWYCARALQPVQVMAAEARVMASAAGKRSLPSKQRLATSPTRDELYELGEAFNGLIDEMFLALGQQQRFTGDAAHQLRTPLAALRGELEVTLRRPRSNEEYERALRALLEQTIELQQMMESLLFLARPAGNVALPPNENIDLADWLPAFLKRWDQHPRRGDLCLNLQGTATLTAPSALLSQLLENLISNALKYSPAGTPIEIHIQSERDSGRNSFLRIAIQDQGSGISPAEREAIFAPFYRSPAARQSGIAGTGLGLALAARIATELGGTIRCEPLEPVGSRFVVELAAARA